MERIGHALRSKDDQQAVTVGILSSDFESAGIALGIGITEDVDGIVVAPVGREKLVQALQSFGR